MASNTLKREEKGKNIQVVVRCRPFDAQERKANSYGVIECDANRKEVVVKTGGMNDRAARKTYTFDMVFGPNAKQIDVYRSVVCPILDEVISGYNCTVFAYGQTGTGKTFTMEGERTPGEEFTWDEDPLAGVIPRTLHQIFEKLAANGTEFSIKVSLLEIYNEELFDLLKPGTEMERLMLFDDPRNKGVVIKGLEEFTVHNKDEVYRILERGAAKRKTASTLMNAYSSRSHSVFSVTIHMKEITPEGEELVKIGKLNLVDLAGSENIGRSGAVDKRAREAGNINQSLLTLGRVITALVEKRRHVPYRESKLTRILQDSLGGRTKTSIIATVSPSSANLEESLSTLEYACRAKNIMNKPEVNQKLTKRTLIKEYTEEIERLKKDLAATRDKNGVFLSVDNYENMSSQITSQEEQIDEYTERLAALEQELKTVMELFGDSKTKLEQCIVNLDEKQLRLEETDKDLQETKEKLTQEEFISSALTTAQGKLLTTAGKLLSTVTASTSDVSGLHAKLDRKKEVEHHNSQIQMSFTQHMKAEFSSMERCVQQQGTKHHSMLTSCSQAMDCLQAMNVSALNEALATVESSLGGVQQLVVEGVAQRQVELQQQGALCLNNKTSQLQLLEERNRDVEEVLLAQVLPGLSAVKEVLGDALKTTVETTRALADKMEEMKQISVFFNTLVQDLATLRETTSAGLGSLQADQDNLQEQIRLAQEKHQTGMKEFLQVMQSQLGLLSVDTDTSYAGLHSISEGMKKPVQSLQQNINTGCSKVESQISVQSELLTSTSSSLASSLRHSAEHTQQMLEEGTGSCSYLHSSLTGLAERDGQWFSRAMEQAESQAQEQDSLLGKSTAAAQALQQGVEALCADRLQRSRTDLAERQSEVTRAAESVQNQASMYHDLLDEQQAEVQSHIDTGLGVVQRFLEEELRQDVPTGMTPQRREFVYPRVLAKSRGRVELLEELRGQQERQQEGLEPGLEPALPPCALEEDDPSQLDLDSLEDEMSNETGLSSSSYVDENLVCQDAGRVPFFKQKKSKTKTANEAQASPRVSRLPLRSLHI